MEERKATVREAILTELYRQDSDDSLNIIEEHKVHLKVEGFINLAMLTDAVLRALEPKNEP